MALSAGVRIGPYEILGALGAGGMGEVYTARDTRLNRTIALKTLTAGQVGHAEGRQRFLQEARATAKLNHPNIVTIHDILEENGVCFLAMEYVAGATLERKIRGGAVPPAEALKYAGQMADALAAAHAAGIIHRDLKPANIIITTDGRAKLLDFGLAQFVEPAPAAADTASLQSLEGAIVGTVAYMSPEQAQGKMLDARSDIFSYGLVVYEMLAGQHAFRADSWLGTLSAILHDEPRPLRESGEAIPQWVERLVARCLRKEPGERFQSMAEVRECLVEGCGAEAGAEEIPSIAVLPFANLSADKENEYFSDGLAEEIINALAKVPELRVIARASAFSFRGKDQDLRTIGQRLRVGTVLEGSVRSAGKRIRVTAQLIQVSDESHLWAERYDREMTDIFAIQDDISQAIAGALRVKLVAPRRSTANIEAFQSYLKGLYWYQRYTGDSLAKARESFEEALRHDPAYAPAYGGLAVFYYGLGALGIQRMVEMAPLAKSAAESALKVDPALSEAHSVLGLVAGPVEYDWKSAELHFRAAMAVDPVPPLVRVRYALYYLTPLGRFDEAEAQYRWALETDPLSMMVHYGLSFALYCKGRYDEAIAHATTAVALYPDYWLVHFAMGLALFQKGRLEDAAASLETSIRLSPSLTAAAGFLAAAYMRMGDSGKAQEVLRVVRERGERQYVSPASFAIYHAAMGEGDRMFEFLEAAWAERDPYLTRVDAERCFEAYRGDARYRALMGKMGLG